MCRCWLSKKTPITQPPLKSTFTATFDTIGQVSTVLSSFSVDLGLLTVGTKNTAGRKPEIIK